MGQHRSFTITTARRPAGLPPPTNGQELWLQVTAGLAAVAGIADVDRLRHALSVGLANREWVESQGCVVEMPGGQCLLISGETAEQLAKLGDLGDQFVAVLRETKWPREILPELTPVEFALSEFDRWLYGLAIRPQQKSRGRNKSLIGVLIQSLAKAWPDLTGEKAMVYPNGIDGEVRGRFYSFVQQACVTFKLACPSPSTVQRFLNPDKRRREAESRKTKSHR